MADKYPAGSLGSDIAALQEAGYDTRDLGTGNTTFNAANIGQMTDCSSNEAARAGHDFRDASAGRDGIPADRHSK